MAPPLSAKHAGTLNLTVKHGNRLLLDRKPVRFEHGKTLEETILEPAGLKFRDEELGHRITSVMGVASNWYHFFFVDPSNGRKSIPYSFMEGKRAYLDLRNVRLTSAADNLQLELTVVSCCDDIEGSFNERLNKEFWFEDIFLDPLEQANRRMVQFLQRGIRGEYCVEPNYFLRQLLVQSKMSLRRLRDIYMRKLLEQSRTPSFSQSITAFSDWDSDDSGSGGPQAGAPDFPSSPPTMALAGFHRLHYMAAEQGKRERAKVKELGTRVAAQEKERIASLEEDILKKGLQLEALMIRNLEAARSSLDCPAAS